jgi:hypothetical protein
MAMNLRVPESYIHQCPLHVDRYLQYPQRNTDTHVRELSTIFAANSFPRLLIDSLQVTYSQGAKEPFCSPKLMDCIATPAGLAVDC